MPKVRLKPIHTILALYTVQMAFFAAIWLAMAWMRLSRRATAHWGLASVLLAVGMGIVLARPWLPPALGSALPNLVHLAAAALLARGVQAFVHRPPSDGWLLSVAGSAALVVAGANAIGAPHDVTVVAAGLGMGVTLLRAAHDVRAGLAGEFGRAAAWACSVPLWIIAGMLSARGVSALVGVSGSGMPLDTGQTRQVVLSLALVLLAMAMHLAMAAMLTLRLVNRLRHLSQHDALTGLLNRRAFGLRLAAERLRQQRQPAPVALLALDLDHFKAVNDRWGHAAGDAVLVAAAGVLDGAARRVDATARMGGEEFALLLPGTDLAGANQLAERLLEAFRRLTVPYEGELLRITASIGVAASDDPAEDNEEIFRRADRALYLAKTGGRDRVVCAGALSLVDSPSPPETAASACRAA